MTRALSQQFQRELFGYAASASCPHHVREHDGSEFAIFGVGAGRGSIKTDYGRKEITGRTRPADAAETQPLD
jgi:hypothetical protein